MDGLGVKPEVNEKSLKIPKG